MDYLNNDFGILSDLLSASGIKSCFPVLPAFIVSVSCLKLSVPGHSMFTFLSLLK